MPWCPKCKNEYKEGYTVCADCGATLVDDLSKVKEQDDYSDSIEYEKVAQYFENNQSENDEMTDQLNTEAENVMAPNVTAQKLRNMETAKVYVEAEKQADNYKSGAYSLLIVGIIGIVFLICMWLGVLPLHFSQFNKIVLTVVMGALFGLFIYQGFYSFKLHHKYINAASNEKNKEKEIFDFLKEKIDPLKFDEDLYEDGMPDEILYFKRIDKMKEILRNEGFELEESFENYLLETAYGEIFE